MRMSEPQPSENVLPRISFERLRERTDELELLISGLSTFALLSLPGWLMQQYLQAYMLLPKTLYAITQIALPMLMVVAYTLGACFLLHLGLRTWWVGLIGLRAVFPGGVRWERMPGLGPLTRAELQGRLPSLDGAIARIDRWASVLFAGVVWAALLLCWMALWFCLAFALGGLIGHRFNATNQTIRWLVDALVLLMLGSAALRWLLDGVLARRWPRLAASPALRAAVQVCARTNRLFFPHWLLEPARLTLQSNTAPRLFVLLLLALLILLPGIGVSQFRAQFGFDRFGVHAYLRVSQLEGGARSLHYESQLDPLGRVAALPLIPAPLIESDWLPLFLPYLPIRDDAVLAQRCPDEAAQQPRPDARSLDAETQAHRQARREAREAARCLARLWTVRLNGVELPLEGFLPTERLDLRLRGLGGHIDLRRLQPGPQRLEVVWRPHRDNEAAGDDYLQPQQIYTLPFVWSPSSP
jgi:hypothetical protein